MARGPGPDPGPVFVGGRPSKKGLLGGDPVAAWEPLGTGIHLAEHPVFESLVRHLGGLEAELTERLGRPPFALLVRGHTPGAWRFRDQQPCSGPQQGGGALGQHGGASEGSRQDPVEPSAQVRIPAADLGSFLYDRDSGLEIQALHRPSKKGGSPSVGLNQHQGGFWPFRRDHEPWEATARTQVGEASRTLQGQTSSDRGKALRMAHLRFKWPWAQEAQGASFRQELLQKGGGVAPPVGAGHRRPVSPRVR